MAEELVIQADGLTKRYGETQALAGVSFGVPVVGFPFLPACRASPTILILTLLCTIWVPGWRTASTRARPAPINSARHRCGGWDNGCSFFTMAGLQI